MKKIWTILSVLLLSGVMVSCDSDKDDNVINDEPRAVNMLFPPQRIELTCSVTSVRPTAPRASSARR